MSLLEVQHLCVDYRARGGAFARRSGKIRAVVDVSFAVAQGETVGLVGESGCGKSTLGRAVVRLIEPTGGRVLFEGKDLARLRGQELRAERRKLQIIFQDPQSCLNPRMVVEDVVGEALDIHRLAGTNAERARIVADLLHAVGLDSATVSRYPHEFSGGQRQRISIARALAVNPRFIVCDEPVSALDVSVQAQVINLLQDLQRQRGLSYLFIAHDLAVVEHISHRILVMYLGRIVESGLASEITSDARHPYTQALLSAVPEIDARTGRKRIMLTGDVPSPLDPPKGCPFHPRCPVAQEQCRSLLPALREVTPGHFVACHLA